jgi:hypothetical protein
MDKIVMWCKIFADFEISVSQCRSSGFRSSRMWCCAVGWVVRLLDPWRWSTMIHQNTVNHAPSDATLCLRRPESWNQNDFKVFLFFCLTILLSIVWVFVSVLVAINMSLLYMVWKSLHVYTWYVTNNRFWVMAQRLAFYFAQTGRKLEFSCGFSTDPDSYRMVN